MASANRRPPCWPICLTVWRDARPCTGDKRTAQAYLRAMNETRSPRKTGIDVLTMGCRLNAYESAVIRRNAEAGGLGDAVIVNTCAVTAEAVRQARQSIRRAGRERPEAKIIATGCAAQIDPDSFAAMKEVSRVVGNVEKLRPQTFAGPTSASPAQSADSKTSIEVGDIMSTREARAPAVDGIEGRARAFVQVQTGCDHRCTFCIIPFGRGNSRSVAPADVIAQTRRLVEAGHYEIVLTGVDLTSWATDGMRLGDLVSMILEAVPELSQLRLSSIDAIEIDDRLFDLITTEPRIAPYLHLSFQSGDDMILKRMKRRHSRADAIGLCQRLRALRPEIAFGADFIAGFPTESEEMFANTLHAADECELDYIHVFPYSARPGTPAARMPQLPGGVIRERAARLREKAGERLALRLDRHVGNTRLALIESGGRARLPDFAPIRIDGLAPAPGQTAQIRLNSRSATELQGQVA